MTKTTSAMGRADAGDMPAWLDEGLASLYSSSVWQNDTLKGASSWRIEQLDIRYLNETRKNIPFLDSLVNYNWQEFNGGKSIDLCKAAVNYALANHFLLYVQEKGKLQQLVATYKSRPDPGNGMADKASGALPFFFPFVQLPV